MRAFMMLIGVSIGVGLTIFLMNQSKNFEDYTGSDDELITTVQQLKEEYLVWKQSVNSVIVTPIESGEVITTASDQTLPSDTILFLENMAINNMGADAYYGTLKPRLLERQRTHGENPNHHMMMFFIESRFKKNAQNWQKNRKGGGKHLVAVGLNQMTWTAIKDHNQIGTLPKIKSLKHYLSMSLDQQLDYTFQHYDIFRQRFPTVDLNDPFSIYAVTFYPKAIVKKGYVVATPGSAVAKQNPGYVLKSGKHKGYITRWSIKYFILNKLVKEKTPYHPDVHGQLNV